MSKIIDRAIELVPAYGREYENGKAMRADYLADKDFLLCDIFSRWDGKPINRAQIKEARYTNVWLRYSSTRPAVLAEVQGKPYKPRYGYRYIEPCIKEKARRVIDYYNRHPDAIIRLYRPLKENGRSAINQANALVLSYATFHGRTVEYADP